MTIRLVKRDDGKRAMIIVPVLLRRIVSVA